MDEAVQRFRRHVGRELGDRQGAERRYSVALRQDGVAYFEARARAGDGLRAVAAMLGVAPVSLRRWAADRRFRPVTIVPDPVRVLTGVAVIIEAGRLRVEGLDVETAAQLIARLR
jgi:hypothetical protein